MALEIFKLIGSVFVDTDAAEDSLQKTDKKAEGLGSTLVKGATTVAKWGTAVVAAGAAGAAALYNVATNAGAAMDEIDKGSAKVGISKKAYQEWSYVLGQNGADVSKLEVGVKTLVAQMDMAASGTKSAQENFSKLGVSIYDANGGLKDQETMLNEALYALASMENGTEKARLATELFGKAGVEMMPMLNGGAEGMAELTERAHDLGLVVSDAAVTAGVVLGDTLDDVKSSFTMVVNKIGVELMPMIQKVLDWVLEHMPEIQSVCSVVFSVISSAVSWLGGIFQSVFQGISDRVSGTGLTLETVMATAQTVFNDAMTFIQGIWTSIGQPVWNFIQQAVELVSGYFAEKMPEIKAFVQNTFSDIQELWEQHLQPALQAIGNFINNVLAPAFKFVFNHVIAPVVDAAFRGIKQLWEGTLKPVFAGILDFITGIFTLNFKKAFKGLVNAIGGIWSGLKTVIKAPINAVIGVINSFIGGINKLKIPSWVPGVGGKGINISKIPYLEKGAVLEKGQTGFLEGNGAEAVVPLEKNKEWTRAVAEDMDSALGGASGGQVIALLAAILEVLEEFAGMGLYLDKKLLVGGLIKEIDRQQGQLQIIKGRG